MPANGQDRLEEMDREQININNVPNQITVTVNEDMRVELYVLKEYFEENNIGMHTYEKEISWPEVFRQTASKYLNNRIEKAELEQDHRKLTMLNEQLSNNLDEVFNHLNTNYPKVFNEIKEKMTQEQTRPHQQQHESQNQQSETPDIDDIASMNMSDLMNL